MTIVNNKDGFYHGVTKGNGNLACGYHGAYFKDGKDIPRVIKKIMNLIMKDLVFKSNTFQVTGIYIDYNLQMVDVKYVW